MTNGQIAETLHDIAAFLALDGAQRFHVRAYRRAARTIETCTEDVAALARAGELERLPGIGRSIAQIVGELVRTGRSQYRDRVAAGRPSSLRELLALPGLGARRVAKLHRELSIATLDELEQACRLGQLAALKGLGPSTEQRILAKIEFHRGARAAWIWPRAQQTAEAIVSALETGGGLAQIAIAGELRRRLEVVARIELVAAAEQPAEVRERFARLPLVGAVTGEDARTITVQVAGGIEARLHAVRPDDFPLALVEATGSVAHVERLHALARERGLPWSDDPLVAGARGVACATEQDVYRALGLPFIEPELREDRGEIEAALAGTLPRLVERRELRGSLHNHTDFSDGANTVAEMADAARAMGFEYLGVTEHSQAAHYAGGLDPERVRTQQALIDQLNPGLAPFALLKGTEVDILPDGELDFDAATLASFDLVVGSVHSHFDLDEDAMTARVVRAIRSGWIDVLGHPTGRLLLSRPGYRFDWQQVIEAAAESGVAIEINASPHRLDVDWRWCRAIKAAGARVAINADAHAVDELHYLDLGTAIARKGWIESSDVINVLPREELLVSRKN